MHRLFRQALDGAAGIAESIIVVMTDIRDFSRFSEGCDSVDVAMFIRRVYIRLIDDYFPFASFYKSTGDGLLLVVPIGRKNLEEVSQEVIASCVKCHAEFVNICSEDLMITFKVPKEIGIGVARGTACCLVSGDTVIDYSGRLLNLASRLTGLARPSGVVVDESFGINLLSEEQKANFEEAMVYLDGIAEYEPIQVYFTKEFTIIPKRNRQPIAAKRWGHKKDVKLYRDLLKFARFRYPLESEAASREDVKVTVTHAKITGGKVERNYVTVIDDFTDFIYKVEAGTPVVWIDFARLCEILKQEQVKKNMNVTISIDYVEK